MSSYQCAPSLSTAVLTKSLWLAYKLTSALSSIQQMAAASSPARSGNLPTCDLACHVSAVIMWDTCLVATNKFSAEGVSSPARVGLHLPPTRPVLGHHQPLPCRHPATAFVTA